MLFLNRITQPFTFKKCKLTGQLIMYGQYYYEDDEDGLIVSFNAYQDLKNKAKHDTFDYSLLHKAQNEAEYRQLMKRAEQEFLSQTILKRKIAQNGEIEDSTLSRIIPNK